MSQRRRNRIAGRVLIGSLLAASFAIPACAGASASSAAKDTEAAVASEKQHQISEPDLKGNLEFDKREHQLLPASKHLHSRKLLPSRARWRRIRARVEAKRFSERVKRHLERRFVHRMQDFRAHQMLMEKKRKAARHRKARTKAREFAAARRHAFRHLAKHRAKPAVKFNGLTFKNPQPHEPSDATR